MFMKYKFSSSFLSLFFNFKIEHILFPWCLILNLNDNTITLKKRNWYLIGINSQTIPINKIREIYINEHLIGSDIFIKIYASSISALYLSKKDSHKIKEILIRKGL